jgi:hypothetical protein
MYISMALCYKQNSVYISSGEFERVENKTNSEQMYILKKSKIWNKTGAKFLS